MKKFTLVELITVIVALSIILAIILINFADLKKKAVTTSMQSNISILQLEVDTYYLKKEEYPIENKNLLSLESPQLISIEELVKNGFQKQKLDTSKIKDQYYWVDVFGKVWGSTKNDVSSVNLIKTEKGYSLEALVEKGYKGYHLYETKGYIASNDQLSNLVAENDKGSRYYKVIEEYEFLEDESQYISKEFNDSKNTYLFSMIDEYGLEAAPIGKFYSQGTFKPLLKMEGEYEFEIAGGDMMYWIDFITLEDTPGDSTIEYQFTIQDENGNYNEVWTDDYFSLDPSKGIKVKVIMTGDDKGNKPSLYDLRVVFKYADDELFNPPSFPNPHEEEEVEDVCIPRHIQSTLPKYIQNKTSDLTGTITYGFKVPNTATFDEISLPKIHYSSYVKYLVLKEEIYVEENGSYVPYTNQEVSGKCMFIAYELKILSVKPNAGDSEQKEDICGDGATRSSIYGSPKKMIYSIYLEKDEFLTKLDIPLKEPNVKLKEIYIEVSYKGDPYKRVNSVSEVKDESCVNIIYVYDSSNQYGYPKPPPVETCKGSECQPEKCEENCKPICVDCDDKKPNGSGKDFCEENPTHKNCKEACVEFEGACIPSPCSPDCLPQPPTGPTVGDKELEDPEWKTVDRVRFFGHGAMGQLTRWYKAEHTDSIKIDPSSEEISLNIDENTRIVYRYAKANGSYWSREFKDFATTGVATSVMAVAYVQVKTAEFDKVDVADYPTVKSMKFYNEKGFLDMSMVQPTLTILAQKDNNGDRSVYSDESNISWTYDAADPRNKKIVDIEWEGDKRDKYPVGTYAVKARVKNEVEIWSEWVEFELVVVQEKPIAKIAFKSSSKDGFVSIKDTVTWQHGASSDPDGDMIVDYEWENKKASYPQGSHKVSLRILDSEGYWSDWVHEEVVVGTQTNLIYRIQSETFNKNHLVETNVPILDNRYVVNPIHDEGKSLRIYHTTEFATFKFVGDGLDIKVVKATADGIFTIDKGTPNEKVFTTSNRDEHTYRIRNLKNGEHTLTMATNYGQLYVETDYIDVYSEFDKPVVKDVRSRVVEQNKEAIFDFNEFSPLLNQSLNIYFTLLKDSTVNVSVLNKEGQVVYKPVVNTKNKGGSTDTYSFNYKGVDTNGLFLQTGFYKMEIKAKGVLGTETTLLYNFYVDQQKPIYRIEAETENPVHLIDRNSSYHLRVMNNTLFSEGKAFKIYHDYEYSTYKFVGDGFDLKLNGTDTTATIILDEGTANQQVFNSTNNQSSVLSVRNLTRGEHTVKVMSKGHNQFVEIDYIDVYNTDDKPKISNVYSRVIDNGVEASILKNDFVVSLNQSLKVYYTLFKDSNVEVQVFDSNNNKVFSEALAGLKKGGSTDSHFYIYNGQSTKGDFLPTGSYNLKIVATGIGVGGETTFNLPIKISNDKPAYRIEAETKNPLFLMNQVTHSTRIITDQKASDKKYLAIYHTTEYSIYKVNGNGFDLGIIKSNNVATIIVDEGLSSEKVYSIDSMASPTVFSVRGLEDKEHTVKIKSNTGNLYINIDYIDVISAKATPELYNIKSYNQTEGYVLENVTASISSKKDEIYKLDFDLIQDSKVEVNIYDPSKKSIKKENLSLTGGTSGFHTYTWDGKENGTPLATGHYVMELKFTSIATNKETVLKKNIYLENRTPSVRIEAENLEDPHMIQKANYLRIQSGSASLYSGGKFNQVYHTTEFYIYKFNGTGFDIRLTGSNGPASLIIDEGLATERVIRITGSKFGYVSLHNLPKKDYTIKLVSNLGNNYVSYDYIDIYE